MSSRDKLTLFEDIMEAADLTRRFTVGMTFEQYAQDPKTMAAVERQLLTISEAAKRLGKDAEEQCPGHDWKGFRGIGDIIRHAYHRIEDELVWEVATAELPKLQSDVARMLGQRSQHEGS